MGYHNEREKLIKEKISQELIGWDTEALKITITIKRKSYVKRKEAIWWKNKTKLRKNPREEIIFKYISKNKIKKTIVEIKEGHFREIYEKKTLIWVISEHISYLAKEELRI